MNARFYEEFSKVDLINATQAAFNNIKSGVIQNFSTLLESAAFRNLRRNTYGVGTVSLKFSCFNIVDSCEELLSIDQSIWMFGDYVAINDKELSVRANYHGHYLF